MTQAEEEVAEPDRGQDAELLMENINCNDPFEIYELFVTDSIILLMVEQTNKYAIQIGTDNKIKKHQISWTPVSIGEMKAFFGRYVDDISGGADSGEQLIEIAHQLKNLCNAGGFPLTKWQSIKQDLLRTFSPAKEHSTAISFDHCTTKNSRRRYSIHLASYHRSPSEPKCYCRRFGCTMSAGMIHYHLTLRIDGSSLEKISKPWPSSTPRLILQSNFMTSLMHHS
ncbi:hypothetical protein M0804_013889 [Polistes exclamans]|nr:hypothetical protein M0804_013889 [Polistes exclamans]